MNKIDKIEKILNSVKNLHEKKKDELIQILINEGTQDISVKKVNEILGLSGRSINSRTEEYWAKRGWTGVDLEKKLYENRKKYKKRLSPFSREFWMEKGYSEQEADYKRNSQRPIKKEYWLEKGYDEKEAIKLAEETKLKNNKKGAEKSKKSAKKLIHTNTRLDYWIVRGYSEEEAKEKITERQKTFTLEKCIEKYGEEEGRKRWQDRQEKWQNTLNSKSDEEISEMNSKKRMFLYHFNSIDDCIEKMYNDQGVVLYKDLESFLNHLKEKIKINPSMKFQNLKKFETNINVLQKEIFLELGIDYLTEVEKLISPNEEYVTQGKWNNHLKWVDEGHLKSSYEIYFYETFKEMFPNKKIMINKKYPNSNFYYDFLIEDIYIEICPLYDTDEKYRKKMQKKKEIFNSVLLKSIDEIQIFLENMKNEM